MKNSAKKYESRTGSLIFHFVIKLFGVTPAYILAAFVVLFYVLFFGGVRKTSSYYLKHRFPKDNIIVRFSRTVRYIYNFALVLIDQAAAGILGPSRFFINFPDKAEFRELGTKKEGFVLLTSHIGAWQAAMATMDHLDKKINFLMQLDSHRDGLHFFDISGERDKFNVIDPRGYMGGLIEATNALNNGECVSIMGDRVMGWRAEKIDFLNDEALFPITAEHLASITGTKLVVFLTTRTGKLSIKIDVFICNIDEADRKDLSRQEVTRHYLSDYTSLLENYLEKYPYMWFNFHDLWPKENNRNESGGNEAGR